MTFGNLIGSLFFAAIITKCRVSDMRGGETGWLTMIILDAGIVEAAPYKQFTVTFAMLVTRVAWRRPN